jgi:phage-related protein
MTKIRYRGNEFRLKRKRKLIAYQSDHEDQVFRNELAEVASTNDNISFIIHKIIEISIMEQVKAPVYKRFPQIIEDFGRLSIGDFRIFVHRIDSENWLMLSIYRKKSQKTPAIETNKALTRLYEYLKDNAITI